MSVMYTRTTNIIHVGSFFISAKKQIVFLLQSSQLRNLPIVKHDLRIDPVSDWAAEKLPWALCGPCSRSYTILSAKNCQRSTRYLVQ